MNYIFKMSQQRTKIKINWIISFQLVRVHIRGAERGQNPNQEEQMGQKEHAQNQERKKVKIKNTYKIAT